MEPADELKIAQAYAETFRGSIAYSAEKQEALARCVLHLRRAEEEIIRRLNLPQTGDFGI